MNTRLRSVVVDALGAVNLSDIARHYKISRSAVSHWKREGIPPMRARDPWLCNFLNLTQAEMLEDWAAVQRQLQAPERCGGDGMTPEERAKRVGIFFFHARDTSKSFTECVDIMETQLVEAIRAAEQAAEVREREVWRAACAQVSDERECEQTAAIIRACGKQQETADA